MYRRLLVVIITSVILLTACSFDDTTGLDITVTETTTTETTENGPIREGNYIYFGRYAGYYGGGGGPRTISWQILKEDDGKLLIISRDVLCFLPYGDRSVDETWETCSLRKWLNEDFINEAFDDSEQEYILTVINTNPNNPEHGTKGGNDTEDKVFLLSIDEAETLFSDNLERRTNTGKKWWLRSPGLNSRGAAGVSSDGWAGKGGYINTEGWYSDSELGVRPALWIKLEN